MSLELERVAYCSHAMRPDVAMLTLVEILAVSDRNNRRDELTGVLLLSRGRFFQVLEGRGQDLDRTLTRIEADPRHRDLSFVLRRPIRSRLFASWGMVAAQISPEQQPKIDDAIDRCHDNPVAAIDLAFRLVERQGAV